MTVTTYATREQLAGWLTVSAISDQEAPRLDLALETASRQIDGWCARRFYREVDEDDLPIASARVFSPRDQWFSWVDDIATTDDLVVATDENLDGTYEATWSASDYQLEPLNTIEPWTSLRAVGARLFPVSNSRYWPNRPTVQVTAQWGWVAVPAPVTQACLIVASNLWKRKDAPFGVMGFADAGVLRIREDPDVALLADYSRRVPVVA